MSSSGDDRKHPPSERKRQLARHRGQVAKSHDLASAASLVIALLALRLLGDPLCQRISALWTDSLAKGLEPRWSLEDTTHQLVGAGILLTLTTLPFLALLAGASILIHLAQTGPLLATAAAAPQWNRVDPVSGFRRILSPRGWLRLGFGLGKIAAVLAVVGLTLRTDGERLLALGSEPLMVLAPELFNSLTNIVLRIAVVLLALGVVDYGFQRWRFEQDLRMTDEELREELRESQGDPLVRQRRKELLQHGFSNHAPGRGPEPVRSVVTSR